MGAAGSRYGQALFCQALFLLFNPEILQQPGGGGGGGGGDLPLQGKSDIMFVCVHPRRFSDLE